MSLMKFFLTAFILFATFTTSVLAAKPKVFLLDVTELEKRKTDLAKPTMNEVLRDWARSIDNAADAEMKSEIRPLTSKEAKPPSGDKHDYMTQAPYFWPDPAKKDGLPYIRRDGERNPEIKKFPDHELLNDMVDAVSRLALGYYVTGKEEYAKRAAEVLRMWYVTPATRMNPNLEYAQFVPGVNTGRGIGLIETRGMVRVVDAVGLLAGSKDWTAKDQADVEAWFAKFLDWMMTSKNGKDESGSKNNHGTYYDVQIADFALFVGKTDLAKKTIETAKTKRIALQIEPDGRQPLELERTKSWGYSTMNLDGLVTLAELGDIVGVDLWNFKTADGRGIRKAIDFLYPFTTGTKWTYQQIEPMNPESLYGPMRRAARHYDDPVYKKMMATVPAGKM